MKECLLNFVQDLFNFPWTREEFLSCNSFRESYDTFHDRIGDCSFEEYVEFFKEFNLECSTLEKSIDKLSDEQLEQVSGGGIGRFIAIPMVAFTLLSGVSGVTGFAASIKAPKAVSFQADAKDEIQDEWAKTKDFVARAGDPWLSMLPLENEDGFDKYKDPEVDFDKDEEESSNMDKDVSEGSSVVDKETEKIVRGMKKKDENGKVKRGNVYPQIYEIVQNFMYYTDGKKVKGELPQDLGEVVDEADADKGSVKKELPRELKIAKYIYVWIAKNIKYDNKLAVSKDVGERRDGAKPGVVFERKDGICAGFARLARLMMRIAKIPCVFLGSSVGKSTKASHAFNAIYVEKTNGSGETEKGWTLMDATWGMQNNENTEEDIKMLHDYFPAAYDNKSLKGDNLSMMHDISHQVKYIDNDNSYILNGVKYTVNDDSISVSSEGAGAHLSLQIPKSILALNKKIKIGSGIEKYKCSGTEEIDISGAKDLTEINTDDSKISKDKNASRKYRFVDGVLYKKVSMGKEKAAGFLPKIDGVYYPINDNSISVSSDSEKPVDLKIKKEILDMHKGKKVKIGKGIKTYTCSGDEEIDISKAVDLTYINTENSRTSNDKNASRKYRFVDGVLYKFESDGVPLRMFSRVVRRSKAVGILPKINGVYYYLCDECIYVYDDSGDGVLAKIPEVQKEALRKAFNKDLVVGSIAKDRFL